MTAPAIQALLFDFGTGTRVATTGPEVCVGVVVEDLTGVVIACVDDGTAEEDPIAPD
jgi:hypothetical protein